MINNDINIKLSNLSNRTLQLAYSADEVRNYIHNLNTVTYLTKTDEEKQNYIRDINKHFISSITDHLKILNDLEAMGFIGRNYFDGFADKAQEVIKENKDNFLKRLFRNLER